MTSRAPQVSCILPVYNAESFLEEAINSILTQTLEDFELIIVDDGSTDGSLEIAQRLAQGNLRIRIVSKPNGGIVSALNEGLRHCRGAYVARMDADDISLPDRFEFQAKYLDDHPNVVVVGGRSQRIDKSGLPQESAWAAGRTKTDLTNFPPRVAVSLHPLIMTRRDALAACGGYSEGYLHAEDYDIFMKLGARGETHNPDRTVLKYRVHGANISVLHLERQERSAIAAEVDNVRAFRHANGRRELALSDATLKGYLKIRIARRRLGLGLPVSAGLFFGAAANLARGALRSNAYTTARLCMMLGFNFWRWTKSAAKVRRPGISTAR